MKTRKLLQTVVTRVNDTLVAQGKSIVLELSFEGRKTYIQLVTSGAMPNDISKVYVSTCGFTMSRAFDWLNTFELAINIK